jgi:hypothetical protein
MPVGDIILLRGQSNAGGTAPPPSGEVGPDLATIPFWKDELDGVGTPTPGNVLQSLLGNASGGSGYIYTLCRILYSRGLRPFPVNIYRGSTAANAWISGGFCYAGLITSFTNALAAIAAAFPTWHFRLHHITDQGEYEARYGFPVPSPAEQAIIDAWPTNVGLTHSAIETVFGGSASRIHVGTNYQLDGQVDPPAFRALQRNGCDLFVTRDTADGVTSADVAGLHPDQPGYVTAGTLIAPLVADYIIASGSLGAVARSFIADGLRNKAAIPAAATHYLHAYADDELTVPLTPGTAASYAPASNANDSVTWPAGTGRDKSNGAAFTFPAPTGTCPRTSERS